MLHILIHILKVKMLKNNVALFSLSILIALTPTVSSPVNPYVKIAGGVICLGAAAVAGTIAVAGCIESTKPSSACVNTNPGPILAVGGTACAIPSSILGIWLLKSACTDLKIPLPHIVWK